MDNSVARRNTASLQSLWCEENRDRVFLQKKSPEAEIQQAWTRETEVYVVTYEPSSHSGSTKLPPPLTPGSHDFLPPLNLGLADTFLVAMAVMREPPPLLIPNAATDGDNRRLLLLLLLTAVPLTKKELLQTTTKDALLAIAISGIDNAVPCVFLFVATLYELRVRCNWDGAGVGRGSALRRYLPTQDRLTR